MGKASKWFRSLLGLRKPESSLLSSFPTASAPKPSKDKRRWSFVKSYRESTTTKSSAGGHHTTIGEEAVPSPGHVDGAYPDKHAITVAAATAAVAEAAVAAAQAAAAVVRLTSSGRSPGGTGAREEWAAIKIQAAFRGCLARRALRALKGLVKLQALVRGHIERKRTAEWLQRMQAIVRAQARARAGRAQILQTPFSNSKSSNAHLHGPATPEKIESPIRSRSMKFDQSSLLKGNGSKSHVQIHGNQEKCWNRSDSRSNEQSWNQQRSSMRTTNGDDEKSVRILEIDSGKPHYSAKRRNLFHSTTNLLVYDNNSQSLSTTKDSKTHQSCQSTSSCEVQSYSPLKVDEVVDSPQLYSASSRECGPKSSPFTPTRSDGSRSYLSSYSDYPSYMAYTESSKAKVRSLSAPKQRPQYERCCSSNRYLVQGFGEPRMTTQRATALRASFTSKAYPGSGRLDKYGMPVGYRC